MGLLPEPFALFIIFTLGLIIGSFLDVFVSRFHTGKSINGRSRCMSCGHTLSWYELFPLLSYIVLQGRCKNCKARIPARLFFMELITAVLFVYVYVSVSTLAALFSGLILISLLIIVALYDVDHMVIPHEFVYSLIIFACVTLALSMWPVFSWQVLLAHAASAVGASMFYAGLWLVSKGRWIGLGDAKLALPLAFMLTPEGAFSMIALSFWIGAGVSVALLLLQKALVSGKHHLPILRVPLTMKSEVPFAPFMIAAFILVYFQQVNVLQLMANFF